MPVQPLPDFVREVTSSPREVQAEIHLCASDLETLRLEAR